MIMSKFPALIDIHVDSLFSLIESFNTKGHVCKLYKTRCTKAARQNFLHQLGAWETGERCKFLLFGHGNPQNALMHVAEVHLNFVSFAVHICIHNGTTLFRSVHFLCRTAHRKAPLYGALGNGCQSLAILTHPLVAV